MSSRWKTWSLWLVIGIALALIVNLLLYKFLISLDILGNEITVTDSAGNAHLLGQMDVAVATIMPMVIGGLLFLLLLRFTESPRWIYWTVLLLILVLSFINPFMIPSISIKAAIGLNILHLAPALFSGISMTRFVK